MIIGNNNNLNSFKANNYNPVQNNNPNNNLNNNPSNNNIMNNDKAYLKNSNATNKNDMLDKSFAMLQERYNNGLISLEEFNKKCNQINKMRNKQ
ncbi:MAG: hypothetical protein IKF37_03410 [Bacilli bacterium]|nr:hypothetical protein [Bacilli bacterium]